MKFFLRFSIYVCFTAFIFFAQNSFAQKSIAPITNDPKAKVVLDAMSKKYRSFKTIKAGFKMVLENTASKTKEEKTGMIVLKGMHYHVEFGNLEITCDNKSVWTYTKDENEVTVNKYDANAKAINPADIFTLYEKGFLYQLAADEKEGGKLYQVIELTPTDKTKNYFKLKLYIDKASQAIAKTKIFDKNGNRYTYEIVQFTPNTAFEDAYFSFDAKKHPGVEVTDNRD
jgi:outer membrane lipoprotein-sorting protein